MTLQEFASKAEALFVRENPGAVLTGWVKRPKHINYRTGLRGVYGTFHAVAEGYKPRVMIADWDPISGMMVR